MSATIEPWPGGSNVARRDQDEKRHGRSDDKMTNPNAAQTHASNSSRRHHRFLPAISAASINGTCRARKVRLPGHETP